MTEIGELSVEDQLRDELRRVQHDLKHVTAERDRAELERDLLGRQQQAVFELAVQAEAENRSITHEELYQIVITDPGDDGTPIFSDVDVAVESGVIKLYGDGDQLIADLPDDRAEILRDMLGDAIADREEQLKTLASMGDDAS